MPEINSPEFWAVKTLRYLQRGDARDRPGEFKEIARRIIGPVVEVGCSFGTLLRHLPPDISYVGVDACDLAVQVARVSFPGSIFVTGDFRALGKEWTGVFRTAVALQVLEHFREPLKAAVQIAGFASERLIFSVPRGGPTDASRKNDGHLSGWADEKAVAKTFRGLGEIEFFKGAGNHICGMIHWRCSVSKGE